MNPKTKMFTILLACIMLFISKPAYADSKPNEKEIKTPVKKELTKEELLNPKIPMPIEHQDFLHLLCTEKNIDFKKTMAIIRLESRFNQNNVSGKTYGYFQVHQMHHANLARDHKTAIAPLNPYINLKWGTTMVSNLYRSFENQGLSGDKLDRAVLSAFNKGIGGYKRTGEATKFINIYNQHLNWINTQYK